MFPGAKHGLALAHLGPASFIPADQTSSMPKPLDSGRSYCTEINSIGRRCSHLATHGDKCGYHWPHRKRCAALMEEGDRCKRMPMVGSRTCAAHAGHKLLAPEDPVPVDLKPEDCPFEEPAAKDLENSAFLIDITDSREFAKAVLESRDFREYIVDGLKRHTIPATLVLRLMDYADGWGRPPERVEHSGRVEAVTEVRRVVIHVDAREKEAEITTEEVVPATSVAQITH